MKEGLDRIKKKIADHDIEEALSLMKSLPLSAQFQQELNKLESRKNKLSLDKRKGIINYEQETIQANSIIDAIIQLIFEIEKKNAGSTQNNAKAHLGSLKIMYFLLALIPLILLISWIKTQTSYSSVPKDRALVFGVKNSILFTGKDYEKHLTMHFKSRNSPEALIVKVDNRQVSTLEFYLKTYNRREKAYNYLSIELDSSACTFLEDTDCLKDGYFQICEHDFDNDKNSEILIAYQSGFNNLVVYIFKYFPPQNNLDIERQENIGFVGKLFG